jgi:hypothetical protein
VRHFLILGLLFFNLEINSIIIELGKSHSSSITTISRLHISKDSWLGLVEAWILESDSSPLVSHIILGSSTKPLSSGVFRKTPGNIRDFFDVELLTVNFLFSLHQDLESFTRDVSHSSGVRSALDIRRDLSEHNWSLIFAEFLLEVDLLPFLASVGLAGHDPRAVWELVSTRLNDHERDLLCGVRSVEVEPFLDLPLEGGLSNGVSSNILDSDSSRIGSSV